MLKQTPYIHAGFENDVKKKKLCSKINDIFTDLLNVKEFDESK